MLNPIYAKRFLIAIFLFIVLYIQSCKETDTIQPYVFEALSVSIDNNKLVFTVDKITKEQDPDRYYQLVLFSITKDYCINNCTYWEITINGNTADSNKYSSPFNGAIIYGVKPDGMLIRSPFKELLEGQYTIGATLIEYNKSTKTSQSFPAIGKFKLSKETNGNWNIEE